MHEVRILLVFFVLTMGGCAWPFFGGKHALSVASLGDGVSVEFIDQGAVRKGGKLYFMPFSAGADAEAGDALDRFSLLMVKGASDAFSEGSGFVLVAGDEASHADILVKGHIETLKFFGHFRKTVVIRIRGDVRNARTGEILALLYAERRVVPGKKKMEEAFYNIGFAAAKKMTE